MSESNSQRKKREAAEYNAAYEARALYVKQYRIALELSADLPPLSPTPAQTVEKRQAANRQAMMAAALALGAMHYRRRH